MTLEELGDDQRRQVVADGQRRTDAQLAVAGMAFKTAFRSPPRARSARRPAATAPARAHSGAGLAEAVEELRVVLPFEFAERRAGRRLRQRQRSAARETLSCRATATKTPICRK
jgi:hypothetical protein